MNKVESKWVDLVETGLSDLIVEEHGATQEICKMVESLYKTLPPKKKEQFANNAEGFSNDVVDYVKQVVDSVLARFKDDLMEEEKVESTGIGKMWLFTEEQVRQAHKKERLEKLQKQEVVKNENL